MAETNLDNEHEEYTATLDARTKSRDLYEGWSAVKAKTTTYLYKEPRESDDEYTVRLNRAVIDNWVEKIVQARQAVMFRKVPKRTLPAALEALATDVDRNGGSADSFFEAASFEAQVDGYHWVAVDMPKAPEAGHTSLAEEKASRHRPFFEQIPANSVPDWEVGPDGQLVWAVVRQSRYEQRMEPGKAQKSIAQWKVWYRDRWEIIEAGEEGNAIKVVEAGMNTSGVVPLVPFFGIKYSNYTGWPVCDSLIEHIVLIYNKRSDLDRSERIAAHPTPVVMSPKKFEIMDMSNGIWIDTSGAAGIPVDVKVLETTGVAFDSIRESITSIEHTIRAHALAQAKKDSAQVESADAQKEYKQNFNSSLRSASVNCESSELRCWKIAALWLGETGAIKVEYNRDFDDATIEEAMISRLWELSGGKPVITRKTLLEILQRGEIIPPELDVDSEIEMLDAEDAEATAALAKSLVPVAQSMPPEPVE